MQVEHYPNQIDMPKENTVKQSLRWMMLGRGITQAVNWLVTLLVIRILTPADYGLLAMAMILIAAAQMLRDMGLQQALIQSTEPEEKTVRQVFSALQIVNGFIFLALFIAAPYASTYFGEPALVEIIRVLAFQFPILALQGVPSAMLSRGMNFKSQAMISATGAIVNSLVTLTLALLGYGVWSIILGNMAGTIAKVLQYGRLERIFYAPTLDFKGFSSLFSFGGFVMASSLLHYIQMRSADIMVGKVLGKESLGIYNVSNRLGTMPMQKITSILTGVGFAAFSKIQQDPDLVKANYLRMQAILTFFAFPVFWGIASVTDSLVHVVLGDKWLAAIIPLQTIAIAAPLRMIFNTTSPALYGTGRPGIVFTNLLLSAGVMPIAFYIGLNWGVDGVARAWLFCYPLLFFIMQFRSLHALGIRAKDFYLTIYRSVIIALSMLIGLYFCNQLLVSLEVSSILRLSILSLTGMLYYIGLSFILNTKVFRESQRLII